MNIVNTYIKGTEFSKNAGEKINDTTNKTRLGKCTGSLLSVFGNLAWEFEMENGGEGQSTHVCLRGLAL